jgi:hypothetical protein
MGDFIIIVLTLRLTFTYFHFLNRNLNSWTQIPDPESERLNSLMPDQLTTDAKKREMLSSYIHMYLSMLSIPSM